MAVYEQSWPSWPARRHAARPFMKRHFLTIAIGSLALVYTYLTYMLADGLLAPLSTRNVIRQLLIASFIVLLVFGNYPKYRLFQIATSMLVPVSVMLVLVYVGIDAQGADGLTIEGRLIEDFSFLFLMTGTCCMVLVASVFAKRQQWRSIVLAGLLGLVFFVIGMEEISWFQRVLEIESGEFFLTRNYQYETNIHNIHTDEFEQAYYLGGFLLLVVFPFLRRHLAGVLHHAGISSPDVFLPSHWMIAPFVIAGAFATSSYFSKAAHITIFFGSLAILIALLVGHYGQHAWWRFGHVLFTLVLLLVTITFFYSLDTVKLGVRYWFGKEYREFYVAWGIAVYAVGAVFEIYRNGANTDSPHRYLHGKELADIHAR